MQQLKFVIVGPPVAWHRTGGSYRPGQRIQDPKDRAYQKVVAVCAMTAVAEWEREHGQRWDTSGEFRVDAVFMLADLVRKDKDNLEKNLNDGMNAIVFKDDSQVVDGRVRKQLDRDEPLTWVTVTKVKGFMDGADSNGA